jgi:hypothetical protein
MKRAGKLSGFIIYTAVWLLLLVWFWAGLPLDGGMVYVMASFYLVLPVCSFVVSCRLGGSSGRIKWLAPVFFGLMGMALGFLTFDLANALATQNWCAPDFQMALISAVPSLAGLCIGACAAVIRRKRAKRR